MGRKVRWQGPQAELFANSARDRRPLESATLRSIKQYLAARNIFYLRLNSGKIQTRAGHWIELCPSGTPDLFLIYRGYHIWIETKRIGEEPEPHQLLMHEILRGQGDTVLVSVDLLDVQRFLYELDLKITKGLLPKII